MKLIFSYSVNSFQLISAHPSEKINTVNTLIHQRTAVTLELSTPVCLRIIALSS